MRQWLTLGGSGGGHVKGLFCKYQRPCSSRLGRLGLILSRTCPRKCRTAHTTDHEGGAGRDAFNCALNPPAPRFRTPADYARVYHSAQLLQATTQGASVLGSSRSRSSGGTGPPHSRCRKIRAAAALQTGADSVHASTLPKCKRGLRTQNSSKNKLQLRIDRPGSSAPIGTAPVRLTGPTQTHTRNSTSASCAQAGPGTVRAWAQTQHGTHPLQMPTTTPARAARNRAPSTARLPARRLTRR